MALQTHSFTDPLNTPINGGGAAEVITLTLFPEVGRARPLCRHAIKSRKGGGGEGLSGLSASDEINVRRRVSRAETMSKNSITMQLWLNLFNSFDVKRTLCGKNPIR